MPYSTYKHTNKLLRRERWVPVFVPGLYPCPCPRAPENVMRDVRVWFIYATNMQIFFRHTSIDCLIRPIPSHPM